MKKVLLGVVAVVALFILWMNLTPGHFDFHCCSFGYFKNEGRGGACILYCGPSSTASLLGKNILLLFSNLDFYK